MHCLTIANISHCRHCRSSVIFLSSAKGKRNFGNFFGFNTASVTNIWCEFNLVWSICVTTEADLSTGQSLIIGVQRPWQIKGGRELTRQSLLLVTPESRVAEVARGHGGPPPKSLDSDENSKCVFMWLMFSDIIWPPPFFFFILYHWILISTTMIKMNRKALLQCNDWKNCRIPT